MVELPIVCNIFLTLNVCESQCKVKETSLHPVAVLGYRYTLPDILQLY